MQVKDLTTDELKILIRETVIEVFGEIFPDLDEGSIVKEDLKQGLLEIQRRKEAGIRDFLS
jgi:RNase P/RNase MRP subunit POP5